MTENEIRDDFARALNNEGWTCDYGSDVPGQYDECDECKRVCDLQADALLASPVIRRIQAEALREARADIQAYTDAGSPFGHRPVEGFLDNRADRIERGETA